MHGLPGKQTKQTADPLPIDVLLLSGVKSASTWLARTVESHPGVCYLRGQELIFDFEAQRIVGFRKQLRPREGQLLVSRRNLSWVVLKMPYAEGFYRNNSAMRFVVLLRDPFSRTFSNIRHTVGKYPIGEWPDSFRKAARKTGLCRVALDTDALFAHELTKSAKDRHTVGAGSLYRRCLDPFTDRFPNEHFLVLPMSKQMRDLGKLVAPVMEFMGLSTDTPPAHDLDEKVNVSRSGQRGMLDCMKGFREVEIVEPSAACLEALRQEFLADARRLDADFGTRAVELWELDKPVTI